MRGDDEDDAILDIGGRWAEQWDAQERYMTADYGWIGEDAKGVWVCRHPEASLLEDPALWGPVNLFRLAHHELTPDLVARLSNFEVEALATMIGAQQREQRARMSKTYEHETQDRD